jgi:hypothetical protein
MDLPRKVTPAPEGIQGGFIVDGLLSTYDELTAERLKWMDDDGEFHPPAPAPEPEHHG